MTKRALIILLAAVNIGLLTLLFLTAYSPPAAVAQEMNTGQQPFIFLAAQADQDNEAVYLLDAQRHRLHVFRTNYPRFVGAPTVIFWVDTRDLKRDFRLEPEQPNEP